MSSVVRGNIVEVRVTLAVTARPTRIPFLGFGRHAARSAIERIARIPLERRRQLRVEQAGPGHRLVAVAAAHRVGGLDRLPAPRVVRVEQGELLVGQA